MVEHPIDGTILSVEMCCTAWPLIVYAKRHPKSIGFFYKSNKRRSGWVRRSNWTLFELDEDIGLNAYQTPNLHRLHFIMEITVTCGKNKGTKSNQFSSEEHNYGSQRKEDHTDAVSMQPNTRHHWNYSDIEQLNIFCAKLLSFMHFQKIICLFLTHSCYFYNPLTTLAHFEYPQIRNIIRYTSRN